MQVFGSSLEYTITKNAGKYHNSQNRERKKALSLHLSFSTPELIEYASIAGFDAVHLDGEHGAFSPVEVDLIVGAAHAHGMSVTARVPNSQSDQINRWLDRGVQGIMAPHIETGAQAQALVDACYFPPLGHRSWGGHRGTDFNDDILLEAHGGRDGFTTFANDNMLVYAQVESKLGYENLDDILAVDGIDAIAFGSFDLGFSLGGGAAGASSPDVNRVEADISKRARAAGKRISSDYCSMLLLPLLLLESGRAFVAEHADDAFPDQAKG